MIHYVVHLLCLMHLRVKIKADKHFDASVLFITSARSDFCQLSSRAITKDILS